MAKLYSYVVEHDRGHAPNPFFGACSLCRCKYRDCPDKPPNVVELAKRGEWVVGTGGENRKRSAGHGRIIYAMRVDNKLSRQQYWSDSRSRKKRPTTNGPYNDTLGDNVRPRDPFEKHQQFALISHHFFYFGGNAIPYPKRRFPNLEKRGPGFRKDFGEEYVARFVKWLESETGCKPGKHGEPCMKDLEVSSKRRNKNVCKSSC